MYYLPGWLERVRERLLSRGRYYGHYDACLLYTSGGPYGVGNRMKLSYTRAMVRAALNVDLDQVAYETDPIFGIAVPQSCPGVPDEVLNPRNTWADKAAYDKTAKELAKAFQENFAKLKGVAPEIVAAGPKVD